MCALATKPKLIEKIFAQNMTVTEKGIYKLNVYVNGLKKTLEVDD